uniref:Uncharacterized protein n=1 Tax=Arundo donax TaxID=35708 RepID=A0A0A9E3R6_ARUDO
MEEPPKESVQSPNGSDSELEPMVLDDSGSGKSHNVDEANGESLIDVDGGQSSMDVDLKGKSSLDDFKGKSSSELHAEFPVDMSVESLEKFCKEASRSFF